MAEKAVPMDVRLLIASWPSESPRGAVTRFCAEHGVSRSQFYEIRARARSEGLVPAMGPRSRRPRSSPNATALEIEDLAVRLRKQLQDDGWDCGPLSVRHEMQRLGATAPSPATLARIFARRGLVTPSPHKRPRSSWRRFTFPAPNACWQLDATDWALLDGTVVVIFQVLDDHSRRVLASLAASGETAHAACEVVAVALDRHGIPQLFLTDNGPALNPSRQGHIGQLESSLRALGTKPITSRPYHPQTCGKNERVHATLKRYLRAHPRAATLNELQAQVDAFDTRYNAVRRHQGIGNRTPLDVWNATPVAAPPTPPGPAAWQPDKPRHTITVTHPTGATNGCAWVSRRAIQIGRHHIGKPLIAVRDGDHVDLFDARGTHIRSVTFNPGLRYYALPAPTNATINTPTQPSGMS